MHALFDNGTAVLRRTCTRVRCRQEADPCGLQGAAASGSGTAARNPPDDSYS